MFLKSFLKSKLRVLLFIEKLAEIKVWVFHTLNRSQRLFVMGCGKHKKCDFSQNRFCNEKELFTTSKKAGGWNWSSKNNWSILSPKRKLGHWAKLKLTRGYPRVKSGDKRPDWGEVWVYVRFKIVLAFYFILLVYILICHFLISSACLKSTNAVESLQTPFKMKKKKFWFPKSTLFNLKTRVLEMSPSNLGFVKKYFKVTGKWMTHQKGCSLALVLVDDFCWRFQLIF